MKRQVYTLGVKEVQGKTVPLVFDYDTNEYIYTSQMNHDRIVSEFEVKEVMLYCYIDGIVRIMDRSFNTIGEVEKLSEVFNTDVRFVRIFAYNGYVEHDEDDDKCFSVVTYNPNSNDGADVSDFDKMMENYTAVNDITHYIAMNSNEDYLANYDEYYIPTPEFDAFIGDGDDRNSNSQDTILNAYCLGDLYDGVSLYMNPTIVTFKLVDKEICDVYVKFNDERFLKPFIKLSVNQINEINNFINYSIV